MSHRGDITDKWHRLCTGCGQKHNISALRGWDGNECCPGTSFTRDRSKIEVIRE